MPSYLGNKKFQAWLGQKAIKAIYKGSEKIYPNETLSLSTTQLNIPAKGWSSIQALDILVGPGQSWELQYVRNNNSSDPMDQSPKMMANTYSGIGPYQLTVDMVNNTTTSSIDETWRVVSGDLSAEFTVHQDAGAKVYTGWRNYGINIGTTSFAATGGTTTMTINVERNWTWNGVGSSYRETNTSTPASVSVGSKTGGSSSGANVTVNNLTTTQTAAYSFTISAVSAVDSSTRISVTVTQAQNVVDHYNYGAWQVSVGVSSGNIPASGGTVSISKSASRSVTPVLTTGYALTASTESATPTIVTTNSSSLISVSQTSISASSRYQTSGGSEYVRIAAEYGGVRSSEVQVTLAANYPTCSFTCKGWTKTTTCVWPSGAPNTSSSESQSEDCGFGLTLGWSLDQNTYINSVGNGGTMYTNLEYGSSETNILEHHWSETITSTTKLNQEIFIGKNYYCQGSWSPLRYNTCVLYSGSPNWTRLAQSGSLVKFRVDSSLVSRLVLEVQIQCVVDMTSSPNCGNL